MDKLHWQVASTKERQAAMDNAEKALDVFRQTPGSQILFQLDLIEARRKKTPNPIWVALKSVREKIPEDAYQELEASILAGLRDAAEKTIEAMIGQQGGDCVESPMMSKMIVSAASIRPYS